MGETPADTEREISHLRGDMTAAHAAFDLFDRGSHVAAQPGYLSLSVRRCRTHSRSSLSVSRVRGSGGQIFMA